MNWFLVYLAGACLAGFIFKVCYEYIPSFYNFLNKSINNAKNDLKNSEDSLETQILVDNINNNTIIRSLEITILLLSWIGLIIDIIYILSWVFDDTTKNE